MYNKSIVLYFIFSSWWWCHLFCLNIPFTLILSLLNLLRHKVKRSIIFPLWPLGGANHPGANSKGRWAQCIEAQA